MDSVQILDMDLDPQDQDSSLFTKEGNTSQFLFVGLTLLQEKKKKTVQILV